MRIVAIIVLSFLSLYSSANAAAEEYIPPVFRVLDITVDVKWDGVEFNDVIEWMRKDVGFNVVVRWQELDKLGIHKDSLVNLELKSIPVRTVMNELMEQLSLAYQLSRYVLVISTDDYFDNQMHVVIYNVTDLLMSPSEERHSPSMDLRVKKSSFGRDTRTGEDSCQFKENKKQLEEAILLIDPNSWEENGGNGTFTWVDGFLVVRNSLKIHEQIEKR